MRFLDYIHTHHTRHDLSGRVIGSSQRPLPNNSQTSMPPMGIETRNPSKLVTLNWRLRSRVERDRVSSKIHFNIIIPSTSRPPSDVFPLCFPTIVLCALLLSPVLATNPAQVVFLYLITRLIFGRTGSRIVSMAF